MAKAQNIMSTGARFPPAVHAQKLRGGRRVTLRPATTDDAERIQCFIRELEPRTRFQRFFSGISEMSDDLLARVVQADGERAVTLLALPHGRDGTVVGLGEYVALGKDSTCEIALVVHDAWHNDGLGSLLLMELMSRARDASLHYMEGLVLRDNNRLLKFARTHGFEVSTSPLDRAIYRVWTTLANNCH